MQTVKTDAIKVRDGFNARVEANDLDGLKLSIERDGILVPLIVKQNGDGVELIAGERRLRVAQLIGLAEVPVTYQSDHHDEAVVHAVENMQRKQLDPVEEARAIKKVIDGGLTEDGAAEALGISKRLVSERLPLLETPRGVQAALADGRVSTRAVPAIVQMAKVSPKLAELAVAYVLADDAHRYGPRELVDDPAHVAAAAVASTGQGKHRLWAAGSNYDIPLDALKLGADERKRAEEWIAGRYATGLPLVKEVIAEAVSVGAAYGIVDEDQRGLYGTVVVISADQKTIREYAVRSLEALEAEEERRKAEQAQLRQRSGGSGAGGEKSAAQKRRDAKERQRARELLVEAREANLDLGVALLDKLAKVKPDKDVATLVCHMILREASVFSGNGYESVAALAAKGLARVLPDWHEFEIPARKDGSPGAPKVKYPKGNEDDLTKRFWRWFDTAKTAEEIFGRLVVALAAAEYAIAECAPRSQRPNYSMADTRGRARKALDRIVKPVLPARVKKLRAELAKAGA